MSKRLRNLERHELTPEIVREFIGYNPETGALICLKRRRGGTTEVGCELGSRHKDGYVELRFMGKCYLAHRLAWFHVHGVWPDNIDHINHDRSDNRLANLREVSRAENQRNQKLKSNNTSGVTGVFWRKDKQRWLAKIKVNYKDKSLGYYDSFKGACAARLDAEKKYGFHENHGRIA